MERKQKVLLVHNYYKVSGGEDSVVSNEKKLLEENGHEVILYTRNNSEIDHFGIGKKLRFPFNAVYNRKTYRDIKKIIEQEKIDIVHVHNTLSLISPAVYYAAIDSKIPVVQTIHNFRMICPGATLFRDGHISEQ
ncbi:MAG: glycosyltransferase [Clostridia bacterium]|nr:glycosyltransferase [Clostridia bacterium]